MIKSDTTTLPTGLTSFGFSETPVSPKTSVEAPKKPRMAHELSIRAAAASQTIPTKTLFFAIFASPKQTFILGFYQAGPLPSLREVQPQAGDQRRKNVQNSERAFSPDAPIHVDHRII